MIDLAVAGTQFQCQARITRGKACDQRGDYMPTERGGRRNAQAPLQFVIVSTNGHLRGFKVGGDASYLGVIQCTVFGQGHTPGGALQQAGAQMFFQAVEGLADGCRTEPQVSGRAHDGAGFHHFDKTGNRC